MLLVIEYQVWYRHSGEEEITHIPYIPDSKLRRMSCEDIARDIDGNHITHIYIKLDNDMPPLHMICPHVTYVKIKNIKPTHNLDW